MFPKAPGGGAAHVRTMMCCSEWHCILLSFLSCFFFLLFLDVAFWLLFLLILVKCPKVCPVGLSKQPALNSIDQVCLVVSASLILTFSTFFSFILSSVSLCGGSGSWTEDWAYSCIFPDTSSWGSALLWPLGPLCGFASCCSHCYSFLNRF